MPMDRKYLTTSKSKGSISPKELESILKRHNFYGVRVIDGKDSIKFRKETGSYPIFTSEAADSIRNHVEEVNDRKENPFLLSLGSGYAITANITAHNITAIKSKLFFIIS